MRRAWVVMAAVLVAVAPAEGQVRWERGDEGWCEGRSRSDRERFCEALTATVDAPGSLAVDAGVNGGVNVQAWDGRGMEVRARVWASARTEERARELARQVDIRVDGGRIRADGPDTDQIGRAHV